MKKTLYVSDLDGTLLNKNAEISDFSKKQLNELIAQDLNFTISTGRGNSVFELCKNLDLKVPIMMLNGAVNFDFVRKEFVAAQIFPHEKVREILEKLEKLNLRTFEIRTFSGKKLARFDKKSWDGKTEVLGWDLIDSHEKIAEVCEILSEVDEINFYVQKNVHKIAENQSLCNITPKNISKSSALQNLKKEYGFDKIIAFGDQENDLPLAEIADEFYAPENATEIVKQQATGIIGHCHDDGVVDFIREHYKRT